ncbi:MAG: SCP-like extracellular [Proteobacteria bacterium]|nr:MAG: SCP-like extracellular [Pseudomonadota bacterium]
MYRKPSFAMAAGLAGGLIISACGSVENLQPTSPPQSISHTQANMTPEPISNNERFADTLAAHNAVRAAHGLPSLTWSDDLAAYAQEWADHLAANNRCFMRHRPSGSPHGENLWWASPRRWSDGLSELQEVDIQRVVNDWAKEKQYYNYHTNRCQPGQQCGHYTQIVWRETTEVGCAYQQCGDLSQLWVCNYNPPGNYIGERPY